MRWLFHPGKAWGWAVLLLLVIPAAANGQYTFGDFTYSFVGIAWIPEDGPPWGYYPVTLTGYSGSGGNVTIPSVVNGSWVNAIGENVFSGCQTLSGVDTSFADSIGENAFSDCRSLTNAVCPSVTNIGRNAFYGCSSLTNVTFPPYWMPTLSIQPFAFSGTGLRSVMIPAGVDFIGDGAFSRCAALTAIVANTNSSYYSSTDGVLFTKNMTTLVQYPTGKTGAYVIPDGVTRIQNYAFLECGNLADVALGSSVQNIGNYAFEGCSNLINVTLGSSVTNIGTGAFRNCHALSTIEFPSSVTRIQSYAFESCMGLTNAWIGDSVTTLEVRVFWNCSNLKTVVMGSGITSLRDATFQNCTRLTAAYFSGAAPARSGTNWFAGATNATIYRLPGAAGWPEVPGLWAGRPTALWLPETKADASLGIQEGKFGFNINWASGQTIVVEACTNLADPDWTPVGTNTFDGDSTTFSDAEWTNLPGRFYRLCLP